MTCSYCHGSLTLLGQLGRLLWLRCRACGLEQSHSGHADEEMDD